MYQPIEKHLLSLVQCGCYISTHDIILIGKALESEFPFKRRSLLLQNLFLEAHQKKKIIDLVAHLTQLLEDKKQNMLHFVAPYQLTHALMMPSIAKITATQLRLHQEFILHVKGT